MNGVLIISQMEHLLTLCPIYSMHVCIWSYCLAILKHITLSLHTSNKSPENEDILLHNHRIIIIHKKIGTNSFITSNIQPILKFPQLSLNLFSDGIKVHGLYLTMLCLLIQNRTPLLFSVTSFLRDQVISGLVWLFLNDDIQLVPTNQMIELKSSTDSDLIFLTVFHRQCYFLWCHIRRHVMSGCSTIGDTMFEQCFHYLLLYGELRKNIVSLNYNIHLFLMMSAGPELRAQQGQPVFAP